MKSYPLSDSGLTIFLFHGVLDSFDFQIRNYTRKHIETSYFESLLRGWLNAGQALTMDDVVAISEQNLAYPPRSFAVTFDDGFLNNLTVAAPILSKLGVPTTFYATTGFIDQNWMSWIDRIEWAVEKHAVGRCNLPWRNESYSFSSIPERKALLDEIRRVAKSDRSVNREQLASTICIDLGETPVISSTDPIDLKMNWNQLQQLAADPLFIVGGHSHTHPILSFLDDAELESEIKTSVALLTDHLGYSPHHYCYPEGLAHCYDDRVIATLSKYGVKCCPTAISGVNTNQDLFNLHRVLVD